MRRFYGTIFLKRVGCPVVCVCVCVFLSFFEVQIQVVFNHGRFLELDMLGGSCMVFFLEEGEKVAVRIHYVFVLRWWGGSRVH